MQQYIFTLTKSYATKYVTVSDDSGHREKRLIVAARQKKWGSKIRRSWRGSLEPDMGAHVGSGNTKKENKDDGWMPDPYCAQHRSLLGAPIIRAGGNASVVELEPCELGGSEPAYGKATAASTHITVISDTPVIVTTHVTAALLTTAAKRRPGRPKGLKKKTNRAERLESMSQRHVEESAKHFSADEALHLAHAWVWQSMKRTHTRRTRVRSKELDYLRAEYRMFRSLKSLRSKWCTLQHDA